MNYDIDLKSLEQTVLNPVITSGTLFYLEAPGWINSEVLLEPHSDLFWIMFIESSNFGDSSAKC